MWCKVRVSPYYKVCIDIKISYRGYFGIKMMLVAMIVVLGHYMMDNTLVRESAFEYWCNSLIHIALVVYHDACPAQL